MPRTPAPSPPLSSTPESSDRRLIPCLLLGRGEVWLPTDNGPKVAVADGGKPFDPFDVVDRLSRTYPLIYLVDLDGIRTGEPQLDFLQELSRDADLWIDGGVRSAEQAIDVIVSGARRAVLSSATLRSPRELERAWRLSTELAFEMELGRNGLVAGERWTERDPLALLRSVRAVGLDHFVVSPRAVDPDWALIKRLSVEGSTWVNGSFSERDATRLVDAGAAGGIFHLHTFLGVPERSTAETSPSTDLEARRDDEKQNRLTSDD